MIPDLSLDALRLLRLVDGDTLGTVSDGHGRQDLALGPVGTAVSLATRVAPAPATSVVAELVWQQS